MVAATLVHPWNRDLCEEEADVVSADDWPGLAAALERACRGWAAADRGVAA